MQRQAQLQQQVSLSNRQRQEFNQTLQDKQRLIAKLGQHVDKVEEENEKLKRDLEQVKSQREMLSNKLRSDPLYNIFASQQYHPSDDRTRAFSTYEQLQQKLAIFHQKISVNEHQISLLNKKLIQRDRVIKDQQREIIRVTESENDLNRRVRQLQQQINHKDNEILRLNEVLNKESEMINASMQQLRQLSNRLVTQERGINKSMDWMLVTMETFINDWKNKNRNIQSLNEIKQTVNIEKYRQLEATNKKQTLIMEDMGRVMDRRNQQIAQLRKQLSYLKGQNDHQDIKFHSVEHSMLQMIGNCQIRDQKYKKTLQKLQYMVDALNKSNQEKEFLRKNYTAIKAELEKSKKQRDQYNLLKEQYQMYKQLYERSKYQFDQHEQNMVTILEENQSLHQLMFEIHGQKSFSQRIQDAYKRFKQRQQQRQSHNKWANVKELVNMNSRLMQRLKSK